jgi:hypothetical protein
MSNFINDLTYHILCTDEQFVQSGYVIHRYIVRVHPEVHTLCLHMLNEDGLSAARAVMLLAPLS